jgi:hypothetical protein
MISLTILPFLGWITLWMFYIFKIWYIPITITTFIALVIYKIEKLVYLNIFLYDFLILLNIVLWITFSFSKLDAHYIEIAAGLVSLKFLMIRRKAWLKTY